MKTKILFNAEDHSYNGEKITYTSVSKTIGKYKKGFNREYWSAYKAYEKVLGKENFKDIRRLIGLPMEDSRLFQHLEEMVPPDAYSAAHSEVIAEWKEKNDASIIKGNNYHNFKENQAIDLGYCTNPFDGKDYPTIQSTNIEVKKGVEYRTPTVSDLYTLSDGFHPELILWNDEVKIAGQSDLVFIETIGKKRFIDISDYKTNKKIDKTGFFNAKMLDPVSHLDDCNYNHYRLQISMYAWLLEKAGFIPRHLEFRHLNTPYEFDYLKKEIESILVDKYDF